MKVVMSEATSTAGWTSSRAGQGQAGESDLVYMISYVMDASLLINQAMELRLTPRFSWVERGVHSSEFIKDTGKPARAYSPRPVVSDASLPGHGLL